MKNSKKKILVLISGSIAAYKACYLISKMVQNGFEVKTALSQSASQFIGRASIEGLTQNDVIFETHQEGKMMGHINFVRWADLIIAIPATGNLISKLAHGIGDDLLSTMALAHDFQKPFLIAPAMNTKMYLHPATQKSISNLKEYGFSILESASGVLACGEEGVGRLLDPDLIYTEIENALGGSSSKQAEIAKTKLAKILIVSGGTVEKIDEVRAITNISSGRTGARIAENLAELGFETFFLGAKNSAKPSFANFQAEFTDFANLRMQLFQTLQTNEFASVIMVAAISDYSISAIEDSLGDKLQAAKIDSKSDEIVIRLKKNPKLLNEIKKLQPKTLLFGFKLTSNLHGDEVKTEVKKQIKNSQCDFVVQNDTSEISTEKTGHIYHIFGNSGYEVAKITGVDELSFQISTAIFERLNQ